MRSKLRLALPAVLSAVLVLAACAPNGESGSGAQPNGDATVNVVYVPKNTDNPYYEAVAFGAREAQLEIGGGFDQQGTAAPDVAGQNRILTTLGQKRQPQIAVAALDPDALAPALKRAMDTGSKVITYDADVQPDARTIYVSAAPAEELGAIMARQMAEEIGYKGKVAILSATITAGNQNAWIAEIKKEWEKPEYKDIELVTTAYGNDESAMSYDQAVGLIQGYPDLAGILSPTVIGLGAAAKAIEDQGKAGQIKIAGQGFPPTQAALLKNGTLKEYVLWSPNDMGYLIYYAAHALATGEMTGEEGDTFEAGRLGTRTIGANGQIELGSPQIYTKDNVDDALAGYRTK